MVAETYEKEFENDVTGICVALLHDAIEDTCETYESIRYVFGDDIANIVNLLTKRKEHSYKEYLNMLKDCKTASRVKYCDSLVNLQTCIDTEQWKREQKYLKNLDYLKDYI